ncbi:MFS general substrate transporter [Corynespora cassiicola Philippines]|uniref:MFS general substrate transporter n=1 Tax=Corynespora cassiicola Philippines TaxID=1448308 RepID=A0A2T2NPD1_CORCC|nr:MFS general substrate transporter [Corynespora cassiicola Philippines]
MPNMASRIERDSAVHDLELQHVSAPAERTTQPPSAASKMGQATQVPHVNRSQDITDQTSRLPFGRLILAYLCLAAIYFIQTLDINSVATALPAISQSLNAGTSITWTGTAYLMGQAASQALYGRLSDIFGRKPVLMACISFLVFGDILCGFAQNIIWLYICRGLSGIGGGGISSLVQITVSDLVSLKDRGKYQGMLSAAIGLGASTGPFIAASMIERDGEKGWRWIFWVPPILAVACMVAMWVLLPLKPVTGSWREKIRMIDWFGLFAIVAAIMLLMTPINSGGSLWPWNSAQVIAMLVVGAVLVVAFAVIEKRVARIPIIPLRLFTNIPTAVLLIQGALYDFAWQVDLYFLPSYFQDVRGYSPHKSATLILPLLLVQSAAGVVSGPLMTKLARYGPVLYSGMALWVLGAGLKIIFSRTTPVAVYVVALIIEGIGIGFVHQPALVALQALSKPEDRAVATSTRNLFRMLGSVAGMAISTAVQFSVITSSLGSVPDEVRARVSEGTWRVGLPELGSWDNAVLDAKMKGIRAVFTILVPLVGLCLISCWWIPNAVLKGDEPPPQQERPQPEDSKAMAKSA